MEEVVPSSFSERFPNGTSTIDIDVDDIYFDDSDLDDKYWSQFSLARWRWDWPRAPHHLFSLKNLYFRKKVSDNKTKEKKLSRMKASTVRQRRMQEMRFYRERKEKTTRYWDRARPSVDSSSENRRINSTFSRLDRVHQLWLPLG
ncbi:Uncharacterized protein Fot_41867 [Forsythia ovata]|uniref:Uncharacterized protein n=1 Tax=Forsythia ovata TaxID=205694 RepID=A0ABD1RJK7_9LAMI